MEYKRETPTPVRFTVPDRPTVRQQLEYFSLVSGVSEADLLYRLWRGAQVLIEEWECPDLPMYKADLDDLTNPSQTLVISWVAMEVRNHMNRLEDIPKNS